MRKCTASGLTTAYSSFPTSVCIGLPGDIVKMRILIWEVWRGAPVSALQQAPRLWGVAGLQTKSGVVRTKYSSLRAYGLSLFLEGACLHVWILSPSFNIWLLQVENMQVKVPAMDRKAGGCQGEKPGWCSLSSVKLLILFWSLINMHVLRMYAYTQSQVAGCIPKKWIK